MPRSASSWRRNTKNFHIPGEHWRAMATPSLSDDIPRSASKSRFEAQASKMALVTPNFHF
ncbi:hypothetical protein A2U01_0107720, partial [Trifolium medium]|nr:hypothetical protein [Trifolium medium]